jgi:hypothetical protein
MSLEFRVCGFGYELSVAFRVWGRVFGVLGSGFRVEGLGFRA